MRSRADPEETMGMGARGGKGEMLEIVPVTLREANAYVEQNHRHQAP